MKVVPLPIGLKHLPVLDATKAYCPPLQKNKTITLKMLQNNELRAISIAVNNKWEEQSLKQEQGYHQRIGRVLPANMTLLVFAILLHLLGGDI